MRNHDVREYLLDKFIYKRYLIFLTQDDSSVCYTKHGRFVSSIDLNSW